VDVVGFFTLVGFGPTGWGIPLLQAMLMTLAVSACAFVTGLALGALGAWAKISGGRVARGVADAYTTVLRGVPELLVIYLIYFGGSAAITRLGHALGEEGFLGLNGFLVGTLAVGVVSGADQTETLRGGFLAVPSGELDAARAVGMGRLLMLRRIIAPRVLRFALPAIGNIWQAVLKQTSLISVTGLVEILRQVHIGAGSTRRPFEFYIAGMVLYLLLTTLTGMLFHGAEQWTTRGERAA
jgi:octopine/nopaline transport system permease protein